MTAKEKQLSGLEYLPDEQLAQMHLQARQNVLEFNNISPLDEESRKQMQTKAKQKNDDPESFIFHLPSPSFFFGCVFLGGSLYLTSKWMRSTKSIGAATAGVTSNGSMRNASFEI